MIRLVAIMVLVLVLGCAGQAAYWGVVGDFADGDPTLSTQLASMLAQRGTNAVLLNMRGKERGLFNWTKVQKAWEGAKASVFWDAPSTLTECDRIHGLGDDPLPMSGQPLDRGTNFLSPRWTSEVQRTAAEMAFRMRSTAGYRIAAPLDASTLASDPDAVKSWRAFLAAFFDDKSPAQDTNSDTATFNSAYGADYQAWDQVPLMSPVFRELSSRNTNTTPDHPSRYDTWRDGMQRLRDMWLEKAQADYVNDMCGTLSPLTRDGLNGPAMAAMRSTASDSSLLASKKFVKCLYVSDEEAIPLLDCAAAVFGKQVYAAPLKLVPGNVSASRNRLLKLLPYLDGAFFDFAALAALDEKGETIRFDPAFDVIPELAPFAGRLEVNRAKVLWIVPSDVPATNVLDAYCLSEDAFALDPNCVDLKQYQAVIYLNSSPCISTMILQRLFDYAVNGGIVFLDAYHIGQGVTLHGRDNGHHWWLDLELKRAESGEGKTEARLGETSWTIPLTLPYLATASDMYGKVGEVTDSTEAKYPLLLVRKIGKSGKGKWVYINVPDVQFPLLRAIVSNQAGMELPDRSRLRVYTGLNCALAIGGRDSGSVLIPCAYDEAVLFDVATMAVSVAKPRGGLLSMPGKMEPGEAKLWVVKPHGKPVLLYADGISDCVGFIDDGAYDGKTLKFKFARRAFVSSPVKPKSVVINGKEVGFEYNSTQHVLKVTRTGTGVPVEAEINYK